MISLQMTPGCGERLLRFVGDRIRFVLSDSSGKGLPQGWRVLLRTNLGHAALLRDEVIKAYFQKVPLAGASWCDIPMRLENGQ